MDKKYYMQRLQELNERRVKAYKKDARARALQMALYIERSKKGEGAKWLRKYCKICNVSWPLPSKGYLLVIELNCIMWSMERLHEKMYKVPAPTRQEIIERANAINTVIIDIAYN